MLVIFGALTHAIESMAVLLQGCWGPSGDTVAGHYQEVIELQLPEHLVGWEIGSVVIQNGIPMHIQIYIWYIPSRNGGDNFVVFPLFAIIYRSFHNFELEPSAQR